MKPVTQERNQMPDPDPPQEVPQPQEVPPRPPDDEGENDASGPGEDSYQGVERIAERSLSNMAGAFGPGRIG